MSYAEPPTIRSSYFVCGTPRSGSTLLCDTLVATGLAGVPVEYFHEEGAGPLLRQWDVRSVSHYGAFVDLARQVATTPNGICGVKLHWPHLENLARAAGCALPDLGAIEALFPKPVFIFLTRADKLGQVFSHLRSEQTHRWVHRKSRRYARSSIEPRFDLARAEFLRQTFAQHEANWQALFDCRGIEPLHVYYEDLCTNYEQTMRAVLRFIGVENAGHIDIPAPRLKKQGGDESRWVQQFLVETRSYQAS